MRPENWPAVLAQYVADAQDRPFAWGSWDCAAAANDWIRRLLGFEFALPALPDEAAADAFLSDSGGWINAVSAALGQPYGNPREAGRGDIALCTLGDKQLLAVIVGYTAVAPGDAGLVHIPLRCVRAAWKVG